MIVGLELKIITLLVYFRMTSRLVLLALLVILGSVSAELKVIAIDNCAVITISVNF